ncbi:hypothetical protein [Peribacillus sp. FSL E2-0218]|uniref:hypothetical protein n=1 Tax=Peribacillus sp. FSL E2-0218 TaxID=2921364 RepID=UPI0030EBD202
MKISVFLIFSSLLFIYGCEDQKEVDQKKYDNRINQVITQENIRLQKENAVADDEIQKREDTGIVVYSNGEVIELMYEIDSSNKKIEVLYVFNKKKGEYKWVPVHSAKYNKITGKLKDDEYIENLGVK